MKHKVVLITLFLSCIYASYAKVKPIIHYNFGQSGNITYAAAPQEILPVKGKGKISVVGSPLFYADAPGQKALKGEGSILFNGKTDGYKTNQSYGQAAENQLFEVWVKAREVDESNPSARVVVANGNQKEGYTFAQQGNKWIFISGGAQTIHIANVVRNQWVHLAASVDGGKGSLWLNGKKTASFNPTKTLAANFSVGISDTNEDPFSGDIYEVRYSTFGNKDFNPDTDLLLDYKKKKDTDIKRLSERKLLIKSIEANNTGKEIVTELPQAEQKNDWLITPISDPCKLFVKKSTDGLTSSFQLNNGLVTRTFYLSENIACVGYKNLSNGAEYLRAVKPEARIRVDSVWYEVGGLKKQPECSYLLESWYAGMEADDQAFTLAGIETGMPLERYPWKMKYNAVPADWPAKGLRVVMTYKPTAAMPDIRDIEVRVNYEIYQGLPMIAKWIEVMNHGSKEVELEQVETEILATNQDQVNRIHMESDFSFALVNGNLRGSALMHYVGTPKAYESGETTTLWTVDKEYNTWATHNQAEDYFLGFPHHNLLISRLPMGPNVLLSKETPFKSYITFELLQDSDDKERKSLGHRRFYKKLAPQTTESLLSGGITSHDPVTLKAFIDQMSELGMERLDVMAWPGIAHDNLDPAYVALWTDIAGYARQKGIIMGGYELQVASRGRGKDVDCVSPVTGEPGSVFGQSVCLASSWKDTYYNKMWKFYDQTGLMSFNMDGPYHGDPCASHKHAHHRGLEDSQWEQWKTQVEVIHELQRRGIYVPIPDWYFLNGQCATGMGYREASANLTPQQQLLLGRQYIYDGTWHKLPTMGWMTLQLVGFYTNDPRVGLEPLNENLDRYEAQLIQFLSSGCLLTIRGNRIYDTPQTKAMVAKWINWYKKYRDILNAEVIHVSRPTGRDLDCMLHVNPFIRHKGMVVVFNPTEKEIEKEMKLPLYYTGLKNQATITSGDGNVQTYKLDNKSELVLPVKIKAGGASWFLIE